MYKPPYDITNKILKLSISITEKKDWLMLLVL